MATGEQVKSLIRSHLSQDDERFKTLALQVAAHEAKAGNAHLAHAIREIVDDARKNTKSIIHFPPELSGLITTEQPTLSRSSLVLGGQLSERISRIVLEYKQRSKLMKHGLSNRRKILLEGPPGTGKTMTARVLAKELGLPLHIVQVDKLVTRYMGETSAKLRQIFDLIAQSPAVYLFDEFDAIASDRNLDDDVGEMRRVINALLQFIEQDDSKSIIIGATNNAHLLDKALFRRFDDMLHYTLPSSDLRKELMQNLLSGQTARIAWEKIIKATEGFNCADLKAICLNALKGKILHDTGKIKTEDLMFTIEEKRVGYQTLR